MAALVNVTSGQHCRSIDKFIEYGTAGFRTRATDLNHVVFRVGLLAVLRAKQKNATIGVMITASHNPEADNGVKLIDPDGEMLEASWEKYATHLANVSDDELNTSLQAIVNNNNINMSSTAAAVVSARDTRPSSVALSAALKDGVEALGGHFTDYGLLTTPQLHYIVRCINSSGTYGHTSADGYFKKLSASFSKLYSTALKAGTASLYKPLLRLDGANGVGAVKMVEMMKHLEGCNLSVEIYNDGRDGKLNEMCGADFVKVQQQPPKGLPLSTGVRNASFDGDADRIVYFYTDNGGVFRLLDGDKIAVLFAGYISQLVKLIGEPVHLGVIQTAYANGASTNFITKDVGLPVECVPTGVKHLHHAAQQFDIGIYFEANGHGTVLFKQSTIERIRHVTQTTQASETSRQAAEQLLLAVNIINQTVGDAISDLLLVESILAAHDWDVEKWNSLYTDLPNRQIKITVKDRAVIETTDAERRATAPPGLQVAIDQSVAKFAPNGRSFVRPSGTEDVVRVYAEADTQTNADLLAYEVGLIVHNMAGGTGDQPKHPNSLSS